ncbi:hypothetical protein JOC86_003495 [Bacillus pakistanensis]|uniref:Uncharacterized protein n=1 Tax=Rossellomorea pakistanensis TaxID=992288 RepID=A0ABS2NGI8_9BACI|nr:hypothetical protein [Bacillus pakistanensis]
MSGLPGKIACGVGLFLLTLKRNHYFIVRTYL